MTEKFYVKRMFSFRNTQDQRGGPKNLKYPEKVSEIQRVKVTAIDVCAVVGIFILA